MRQLHSAGTLQFYIDCHAHSNKRGCFLFGNQQDDAAAMTASVTYAKCVEANCRWFDFDGCVYSAANNAPDKRDGLSKEGSGRVATYRMTGLTHAYTLECSYNMGRKVNRLLHPHAPEGMDQHRSLSPQPPLRCLSPKYTPECWQSVGKALAISALDVSLANPCSRLGAPGKESSTGLQRLTSGATAWLRLKERQAATKKAAGTKANRGGSDDEEGGGSDDEGAEGGGGDEDKASHEAENVVTNAPAAKGPTAGFGAAVARKPAAARGAPRVSALTSAATPFWAQVVGTPLVRKGCPLNTPPAGRLEGGSRVLVLETKPLLDGTLRACLAQNGAEKGWMTLAMRDGTEHAKLLHEADDKDAAAARKGMSGAEPVAAAARAGGALFVF